MSNQLKSFVHLYTGAPRDLIEMGRCDEAAVIHLTSFRFIPFVTFHSFRNSTII